MKCIKLLFFSLIVFPFFIQAQSKWVEQTSGVTNNLYGIFFTSPSNGWAVGEAGTIIHSSNGGNSWSSQTSGLNVPLNDVFFTTNNKGCIVANQGNVLLTSNGGNNWNKVNVGTTNNLNSVVFADSNYGWITGTNGIILHTKNGGTTWANQNSPVIPSGNSIDFVDTSYGWIVADNGKITATTNGGSTWTAQTSGTGFNLMGVSFADKDNGFAVGIGGTILKTTNGGSKWTSLNSETTDALLDVHCLDSLECYAIGTNGLILYTDNGGTNWQTITSGLPTTNLRNINFFNKNPGWICGNNGKILNYNKSESICIVTVDTTSYKYKIIWEQIPGQSTSYYNIYKLQGLNYVNIGTVPYTSLSEFVDVNSNPNNKSERYKISRVDSFGNESELSPYHEIMFLQASSGVPSTNVNLSWNQYSDENGQFVPEWYYIYGGSLNNLVLIDSVSGGGTPTYTDNNVFEPTYYRISYVKPGGCTSYANRRSVSTGGPYSQSISNLEDYSPNSNIDYLDVYPLKTDASREAQILSFNVFTNLSSWNVSSDQSWAFPIKDLANKTISVTISENIDPGPRVAKITLSNPNVDDAVLTINQSGTSSTFAMAKEKYSVKCFFDKSSQQLKVFSLEELHHINQILVYDLCGRTIYNSGKINSYYETIETTDFESGVYFVKVVSDCQIGFKVIIY